VADVRHARPEDLDRLESLLTDLRAVPGLRERSRGTFSNRSRAFLHFHAEGDDLYADVRLADDFERVPVTSRAQQAALVSMVRSSLAAAD
jgi:hypothetical protein